jgi:hypothetical protein
MAEITIYNSCWKSSRVWGQFIEATGLIEPATNATGPMQWERPPSGVGEPLRKNELAIDGGVSDLRAYSPFHGGNTNPGFPSLTEWCSKDAFIDQAQKAPTLVC